MIILYHYVHCPFCIRVRLALGFLDIDYQSKVLSYADEKTPVNLCQKKMLPIISDTRNDISMNESLDIIAYLDKKSVLKYTSISKEFNEVLNKLGKPIHNLCMPYWMYSKEFTKESRKYFQEKKEIKRGPFHKLAQKKESFLLELTPLLENLEKDLSPYYKSDELSLYDICLASHLWGLYLYPEFQFSLKIHRYLQNIKVLCHFDYHQDFWKTSEDALY